MFTKKKKESNFNLTMKNWPCINGSKRVFFFRQPQVEWNLSIYHSTLQMYHGIQRTVWYAPKRRYYVCNTFWCKLSLAETYVWWLIRQNWERRRLMNLNCWINFSLLHKLKSAGPGHLPGPPAGNNIICWLGIFFLHWKFGTIFDNVYTVQCTVTLDSTVDLTVMYKSRKPKLQKKLNFKQ